MKRLYNQIIGSLAMACLCLLAACSSEDNPMEQTLTKGEPNTRELVSAELTGLATDGFQAALQASLGDNALNVQKLTLSGEMAANDVAFLKKLTALEEMDMTGVTLKASQGYDVNGNYFELKENSTAYGMFANMEKLVSIAFPANLVQLNGNTCEGCTSLKSVTLPNTLKVIDWYAFRGCKSLEAIAFPQSLEEISGYAFNECSSLKSIEWPASVKTISQDAFSFCTKLVSVSIPEGVTTIEQSAFSTCQALTSVVIPSSVTKMANHIFAGCSSLKSAKVLANINALETRVFSDCPALEEVELSSSITTLGNCAFDGCTSLKDYTPFCNITEIGYHAFQNCGFTSADLSAVTLIREYAFYQCKDLVSVTLGNSLSTINYCAFMGTNLETLRIPASVTTAEYDIVGDCRNLSALFWDTSIEVPYMNIANSCLLYLQDAETAYSIDWKNVIKAGVAESIELSTDTYWGEDDYNRYNHPFRIPQAFTAQKISYTRIYDNWTPVGSSGGWYGLVLPFKPTSITHETKGAIAPFNSGIEGAKPFWLRKPTTEGFEDVTEIEPGMPYIVAMPYNDLYGEDYQLNGQVTFSAENVEIAATPERPTPVEGPGYYLHASYENVPRSGKVYVLNTRYDVTDHSRGSLFVRLASWCYPFEIYATTGADDDITTSGATASTRPDYLFIDTASAATRSAAGKKNTTGIPQIGDK